ncbi:epoxyqueuosine reductase, partial [Chloroflexota bacterium]
SHNLLTPEYGPRVRFVSVFTSVEIEANEMLEKDLCIKCKACAECCPVNAIIPREDSIIADYDGKACTGEAARLTEKRIYPCGICIKVCPIGDDRKLYKQSGITKKYLKEKDILSNNSDASDYRAWNHIRRYGRLP